MQSKQDPGIPPKMAIIYEDSDVLVINKPAGITMHAKNSNDHSETVQSIFASQLPSQGGDPQRRGIVHRLDRDTSGVVILAKTQLALEYLQAQFAARTVGKQYYALVWGHLKQPRARIELPIRRSTKSPNIMAVHQQGRQAITEYNVVTEYPKYSLLDIKLHTGRTHQIRAQFAHLGHPVVGDKSYGSKSTPQGLTRQFLHAYKLSITLPGNKVPTSFEAPLATDLQSFLDGLNG